MNPVYIQGTETGNGVIEALILLGGKNDYHHKGNKKAYIYFLDPETNVINYVVGDSTFGKYIKGTAKEIKPLRWRAKEGCTYYTITSYLSVAASTDDRDMVDNDLYKSGNYFQNEEDAIKVLKKIKPYFDNV